MLPFGNFWEQNLEQNLFLVYFKTVDKTLHLPPVLRELFIL
jgi:hypothetical protein